MLTAKNSYFRLQNGTSCVFLIRIFLIRSNILDTLYVLNAAYISYE
nr:MAG TPA: hypothetical protein [Caudoviricetes sp.]